jgi:hypothetical protein
MNDHGRQVKNLISIFPADIVDGSIRAFVRRNDGVLIFLLSY